MVFCGLSGLQEHIGAGMGVYFAFHRFVKRGLAHV
jgi:hypothetical protein